MEEAVNVRAFRAKPIFNYAPGKQDDRKRLQARFRPHETNGLQRLKNQVMAHVPPTHTADQSDSWVVLVSKVGCQDQQAHRDYDPKKLAKLEPHQMPLAVVVAFEDDTKLHAWRNDTDEYQLIVLNAGDLVLFRGDLVHAGAGYDEGNIRVHAYLDSGAHIRSTNRTYVTHHVVPS